MKYQTLGIYCHTTLQILTIATFGDATIQISIYFRIQLCKTLLFHILLRKKIHCYISIFDIWYSYLGTNLKQPQICVFFSFLANENEFDAIVFFSHKLNRWSNVPDQSNRKSGQRYVMFTQESPLLDSMDRTHFNGFFNWTMTYRCDNITYYFSVKLLDSVS